VNNQPLFENYKKAFDFHADSGLRDIYVFNTDKADWQTLIDDLRSNTTYSIRFLLDQKLQPLPHKVETIFHLAQDYAVSLRIDEEQLNLHCYFFTPDQIEFDLDPRDIQSDDRLVRLLDFIHHLGNLLQKPIVLTPESVETIYYLTFDPKTGKDEWSLPEWSVPREIQMKDAKLQRED